MAKHSLTQNPDSQSYLSFIAPRYWLTWCFLAFLWLLAHLPFAVQMRFGRVLGWLSYRLAKKRRRIGQINIGKCFPEKTPEEQKALLKAFFVSSGKGLMETATCWIKPASHFAKRVTIEGEDNIRTEMEKGKGVILLGGHFVILDLMGAMAPPYVQADMVHRNHNNPLFDLFMTRARERLGGICIARKDLRLMVRRLKQGKALWYPPDMDYGRKNSVFIPFFNIPAATITATSGLAKLGRASVVPVFGHRTAENDYNLKFYPPLQFCADDPEKDAAAFMAFIEQRAREHPEQYLWTHRRFKTRPEGESGFYPE